MDSSSVAEVAEEIVETTDNADLSAVIAKLDEIIQLLTSVDYGIKFIIAVSLLLLAFYGVWKIFNDWYFGGV